MAPNLIDQFHRAIYAKLSEEISRRMIQLAEGSAKTIQGSDATVAEKYAAQVSYIEALNDVLDMCQQIENDIYGTKKPDDQ